MPRTLRELAILYLENPAEWKSYEFSLAAKNEWDTNNLQGWRKDAYKAFYLFDYIIFNTMCEECSDATLFEYLHNICEAIVHGIEPIKPYSCNNKWCI